MLIITSIPEMPLVFIVFTTITMGTFLVLSHLDLRQNNSEGEYMKKIFVIATFLFLLLINILVIIDFSYTYPKDYFSNMTLISVNDESDPTVISPIVNKIADDMNVTVIAENFAKNENGTRKYKYFSNKELSVGNYPNIFSTTEIEKFSDLRSQENLELNISANSQDTENFIKALNQEGLTTKYLVRDTSSSFFTIDIYVMIFTFTISYIILLGIYIYSIRKRNVLYKLNGLSNWQITNINAIKLGQDIKYVALTVGIIDLIILVYYQSFNLKLIENIILATVIFVLILALIYCSIVKFSISKTKDTVAVLKNKIFSPDSYNFMLLVKVVFTLSVILVSLNLLTTLDHVSKISAKMAKYDKYSNIIVTQTYDTSQAEGVPEGFDMDFALLKFYELTVDKFNGVIANGDIPEFLGVNNNYFNYVDYYDIAGNKINADDKRFDNKTTFLVPESQVDNFVNNNYEYDETTNLIIVREGQVAPSLNLYELDHIHKNENPILEVYPRDLSKVAEFRKQNLGASLTGQSYYMDVPGDNSYTEIQPYLEESGADRYIFDTAHLTLQQEWILSSNIEKATYLTISLILATCIYLISSYFMTDTYMLINMKKLINLKLSGVSNLRLYTKVASGILIADLVIIGALSFIKVLNLYIVLGVLLIDVILTYFIYHKYMMKNFIRYMKGEL